MRVMIIGQKWFGAEVLKLCLARGDDVAAVSAPRADDRLAALKELIRMCGSEDYGDDEEASESPHKDTLALLFGKPKK